MNFYAESERASERAIVRVCEWVCTCKLWCIEEIKLFCWCTLSDKLPLSRTIIIVVVAIAVVVIVVYDYVLRATRSTCARAQLFVLTSFLWHFHYLWSGWVSANRGNDFLFIWSMPSRCDSSERNCAEISSRGSVSILFKTECIASSSKRDKWTMNIFYWHILNQL